jgi:hypothetical protein
VVPRRAATGDAPTVMPARGEADASEDDEQPLNGKAQMAGAEG